MKKYNMSLTFHISAGEPYDSGHILVNEVVANDESVLRAHDDDERVKKKKHVP